MLKDTQFCILIISCLVVNSKWSSFLDIDFFKSAWVWEKYKFSSRKTLKLICFKVATPLFGLPELSKMSLYLYHIMSTMDTQKSTLIPHIEVQPLKGNIGSKWTAKYLDTFTSCKEGDNTLKSVTCQVPLICPTPSPLWGGTSPIPHLRGPPQSQKVTKNTTEISRSHLAAVFIGKEGGKSPKICHLLSLSNFSYHIPSLGMIYWPSVTHRAPLRAPKQQKIPPRYPDLT